MDEILCKEVRCVADIRLEYRLMQRVRDGRQTYDLLLTLVQGDALEICELPDMAPSEAKARAVYALFRDELVMPIHAADIMEEILSDVAYF